MSELADGSDEHIDEDPIEISADRYERIIVAAVEGVPSLSSWIWGHGNEIVGEDFHRIRALLERLPVADRDAILQLVHDERVGALHDLLVRIDGEMSISLEGLLADPQRFFGTLHHDFMGALERADDSNETPKSPETG
ncbi:hypothetical protein [Ilumatobacter sp.]|uniref:hypothetical protein n=1 Tax=Ilumatobacter sp. TaxID=1967498 RepID=UPI003AF49C7A